MQKLLDLSEPLVSNNNKTRQLRDEFFGVYCLVSKSELKLYKNRCYIGYTVDPNRRIRQHNAGVDHGGAKKTDNRGPWDMVCIIHGFPNSIAALQFEWAWQNPDKSKRIRRQYLQKSRSENQFTFRFRVACQMLITKPWQEMALTFRWLIKDYELPFPPGLNLPSHMNIAYGEVQKTFIAVPSDLSAYTTINDCHLCKMPIRKISNLITCANTEICFSHFHGSEISISFGTRTFYGLLRTNVKLTVRCLAEHSLAADGTLQERLYPMAICCPKCSQTLLWPDLVKDQHSLMLVEESKPIQEGMKIANGLIPKKLLRS